MHITGSYMAQTPGRTSQESSWEPWTFRKPNTLGSQGVCFALLDVGFSQFMPNTKQSVRFCPRYIAKTAIFAHKHQTWQSWWRDWTSRCSLLHNVTNFSQTVKQQGRFFPFGSKSFPFKTPAQFAANLTFWMPLAGFPPKVYTKVHHAHCDRVWANLASLCKNTKTRYLTNWW